MKNLAMLIFTVGTLALPSAFAESDCLDCHDQTIQKNRGITISNIKAKWNMPYSVHNSLDCLDCHTRHDDPKGGKLHLSGNFPTGKHSGYIADAQNNTYGLCFSCHDASMLNRTLTGKETRFFNDTRFLWKVKRTNLHWKHVTTPIVDGNPNSAYSCSVCHDVHGSMMVHNLRPDSLPGHTPMKVKTTEQGGRCAGACHSNVPYRRML